MIHLPDPVTSDVDPMEQLVLTREKALRDARARYAATALPEDGQEAVRAFQSLRKAKLLAWGVTCPECGGDGDVPFDILPASTLAPEEMLYRACPTCRGEGVCLPHERDSYQGEA